MFGMTLAFILVIGEVTARYFISENILPPPPPPSTIDPYSPNPYLIGMRPFMHFHIPGSKYIQSRSYYAVEYNINSSAFRGPEILPKSDKKKRAVIIGDSIVEGHGCDFKKTFTYNLGEKAAPLGWEVLNLGVQGASPSYFAANIGRYMATDPDAAIVVIFENDMYDDKVQEKNYFNKALLDTPEKLYPAHANDFYLSEWSKLFILIKRFIRKVSPNEFEEILKNNSTINTNNDEQEYLDKIAPWLVAPSVFDAQWNKTQKYLDYITRVFYKNKVPVFVIYLSLGGLVPGQDKQYAIHANNLNDRIEKWSNSKNIPFLSLLPTINDLLSKMPVSDIMIMDDGHPTEKAHQIFAEKIWKWLADMGNG